MIGVIGCDVGQVRDPAALVVLLPRGGLACGWLVAESRRLPLGTSYTDLVTALDTQLSQLAALDLHPVAAVDATGVGRVIVELARARGRDIIGVTATGGHRVRSAAPRPDSRGAGRGPRDITVPQAGLVGVLSAGLESGRLTLAADTQHLQAELAALTRRGRRVEAARGHHDDLAYACAIGLTVAQLLTNPDATHRAIETHAQRIPGAA